MIVCYDTFPVCLAHRLLCMEAASGIFAVPVVELVRRETFSFFAEQVVLVCGEVHIAKPPETFCPKAFSFQKTDHRIGRTVLPFQLLLKILESAALSNAGKSILQRKFDLAPDLLILTQRLRVHLRIPGAGRWQPAAA